MRIAGLYFILVNSIIFSAYVDRANAQDDCESQETCKACVRTPTCVWCDVRIGKNEDAQGPSTRCAARGRANLTDQNNWCEKGTIIDHDTVSTIVDNAEFSSSDEHRVQLKPQKIKLQLRRGEEHKLRLQFKQGVDYPVDLYFLVDLSYSMTKFRNDLSTLGLKLADELRVLTKNFRLGFGSFVDKATRPMTASMRKWDNQKHFSYKHHMSLTDDIATFKNIVRNAPVTGNADSIEGGLDGLMQAMVCDHIKWRPEARHLLVYVSDQAAHIGGDGKLAGLPKPNDEKCHLNKTLYYDHAEKQDYPSLGQINWHARKNNINVIFASTKYFEDFYKSVASVVQGSSVGIFDQQSEKVIALIKGQYENLVKTLTMTSNASVDYLDVKFYAKCPNGDGKFAPTNVCNGIRVGHMVAFEVTIKAIDCPEREEDWRQVIEIKPEGINERVIVDLEIICDCKCSRNRDERSKAPRAEECSMHGILDCGVCSCDRGHSGKRCQCEAENNLSIVKGESLEGCLRDNSSEVCSGRGSCVCGSCNCERGYDSKQRYYGKFCQCDNLSCRHSSRNGKLCGGNGLCDCGVCKCRSGWGGPACDCRDDLSRCLPPGGSSKICNGAGTCECGECKCEKGRNGKFCEDCRFCPSQRCDEFKDCVECVVHKSGKIYETDNDCSICFVKIDTVDQIEQDEKTAKENGEYFCRIPADDGSWFIFTYVYGDVDSTKDTRIVAKKTKDYPAIADSVAVTIGVILLTILLGFLILLIWKVLTNVHDKREYQKFIKQGEKSEWGRQQNPLYENPVTTFQNPTFDDQLQDDRY